MMKATILVAFIMKCAQDEIRTRTTLRMPPPQDGASTNFATWAHVFTNRNY